MLYHKKSLVCLRIQAKFKKRLKSSTTQILIFMGKCKFHHIRGSVRWTELIF